MDLMITAVKEVGNAIKVDNCEVSTKITFISFISNIDST